METIDVRGGRAARRAHPAAVLGVGHRVRDEGGQATAEFALVLPFMIVLLLALLQVALIARDQVRVSHASREAARAESVDPGGGRARDAVRHLLGDASVEIRRSGSGGLGDPVTATVRYRSRTEVPLVGMLFPDIELIDHTTMRSERESR